MKNKIITSILAVSILGTVSSFCLGAFEVAHAEKGGYEYGAVVDVENKHHHEDSKIVHNEELALKMSADHCCAREGQEAGDARMVKEVRGHDTVFIFYQFFCDLNNLNSRINPEYWLVPRPPPEGASIASIVKRE